MNVRIDYTKPTQNGTPHSLNFSGLPVHSNEIKFNPSLSRREFDKQKRIISKEESRKVLIAKQESLVKFERKSKYLEELQKRKNEIAEKISRIKNNEEKNNEKIRDYEFLNLNLEKNVYKLPLPKIVHPANRKTIQSHIDKKESGKYSRINIDQDEYDKLMYSKRDKNIKKIQSSYYYAIHNSIKERKNKAIILKREMKDQLVDSTINTLSTENSNRMNKPGQSLTHRYNNDKLISSNNFQIVKVIDSKILNSGEILNKSKINDSNC